MLAWHYEQGVVLEHAVHSHRRAGDRAVQAYAYQAALAHYDQGVALLTNLPDAPGDRLALLLRRQRVLRLLARLETWRRDVDEIEHLAAELGDTSALLEALEARLRLTNIASDMTALREAIPVCRPGSRSWRSGAGSAYAQHSRLLSLRFSWESIPKLCRFCAALSS